MTNTVEIKVPDIGDFDSIPVIELLVHEGDDVAVDDSLITLESDKATMEVPASDAGKITKMLISVGDSVSTGDVIAILETSAPAQAQQHDDNTDQPVEQATPPEEVIPAAPAKPTDKAPETISEASNDTSGGSTHASPSVRKLSRKLNINLSAVTATGRKGRITEDDLHAHINSRLTNTDGSSGLSIAPAKSVDFSKFGNIKTEPLSRIKKISGAHLHRNWVSIPHVTQHDQADVTDLESFRKAHDAVLREQGTRLTLIVLLIKACVAALREHPQFNASLSPDGESLILKEYFHIGIAVDTPDGLVVPVIRDCDTKTLTELAHELTDLSGRAREGKLKPGEMQGGCFSISSLGGIGGTAFTPIVNGPEVAILGVSRSAMAPVWDGNDFQPRLMLPLSMSYDHRVIDGASAARFTRFLATRLEDFRRVLL